MRTAASCRSSCANCFRRVNFPMQRVTPKSHVGGRVTPRSDGGGRLVVEVAASVIRKADRRHPADAVLRAELRDAGQRLSPAQRSEVADAVFNYYRWLGWLEPRGAIRDQLARASELARSFVETPHKFS